MDILKSPGPNEYVGDKPLKGLWIEALKRVLELVKRQAFPPGSTLDFRPFT